MHLFIKNLIKRLKPYSSLILIIFIIIALPLAFYFQNQKQHNKKALALAPIPASVVTTSSNASATYSSTQKHFVRTSDGTFHLFIQVGTIATTCGGVSTTGLVWLTSPDNATWTCQGQLSADTSLMAASVTTDALDSIYTVYSLSTTGGGTDKNVYFRKLTKGTGSTWTLEAAQTVLTGTSAVGYGYATIEMDGTGTIWIAARHFDGTNYSVTVYNSDNPTNFNSDSTNASPTWSQSIASSDTPDTNSSFHYPVLVDYGDKIGVIYNNAQNTFKWRFRKDNEPKNTWVVESVVRDDYTFWVSSPAFTAIGDEFGTISLAAVENTPNAGATFTHYDGRNWSVIAILARAENTSTLSPGVSLSTDGTNVWIFYGNLAGLDSQNSSRMVYKKGVAPFSTADFTNEQLVASYHTFFDKVWVNDADAPTPFEDKTTAASNENLNDIIHSTSGGTVKDVGDAVYFGKTTIYDSVNWAKYPFSGPSSLLGTVGAVTWEYWNGTSWVALTLTSFSGLNFERRVLVIGPVDNNGNYLSFTPPADWVPNAVNTDTQNYYYVRARATLAYTSTPLLYQAAAWDRNQGIEVLATPVNDKVYSTWNENALSQTKIRSSYVEVLTSPPPAPVAEVSSIAGYSALTVANFTPSANRRLVRTSDGTQHLFISSEYHQLACGGATGNNNTGVMWITSNDNGNTWTCRGQLRSGLQPSNAYGVFPLLSLDARVDAADNIYVVYPDLRSSADGDIKYRKLTKGVGSNWTMEAEQVALAGDYIFASLETDGTRLWLAAKFYDETSHSVYIRVFYSDGFGTTPTWTQSISSLDIPSTDFQGHHHPTMVRFGSKIGIIYDGDGVGSNTYFYKWRYRSDSDPLDSWSQAEVIDCYIPVGVGENSSFSAIGDSAGNIYFAANAYTGIWFSFYNGTKWSEKIGWDNATPEFYVQLAKDDKDSVWVFYGDTTDIAGFPNTCISSCNFPQYLNQPMYRHLTWPYSDPGSKGTLAIPSTSFFEKVWVYNNASLFGKYQDKTSEASTPAPGDVFHSATGAMIKDLDDAVYFGKKEKFDAIATNTKEPFLIPAQSITVGKVLWEYWNGSSWKQLTDIPYNHYDFTPFDFYDHNVSHFVPHTDWATTSINGESESLYYIRARVITPYPLAPIGSEMLPLPNVGGASILPDVASNNVNGVFHNYLHLDNSSMDQVVRHVSKTVPIEPVSIAVSTAATSPLSPVVTRVVTDRYSSKRPLRRDIVRTSDNTVHSFIQVYTKETQCNGSTLTGLLWFSSTDEGNTWTCKGQLAAADIYNSMYASATVDAADNIYVVYSLSATADPINVYYRKLTKSGSNWTLGAPQIVLTSTADNQYSNAFIEVEGTNRLWISARHFDNNLWQSAVTIYYSDDLSPAPGWTQSIPSIDTPGSNDHYSTLVKFGSKIGVLYTDDNSNLYWRYRNNTDPPDSWSAETTVVDSNFYDVFFSAVGDPSGNVYLIYDHDTDAGSTDEKFTWFNGTNWTAPIILSSSEFPEFQMNSISYDTAGFIWVFYNDVTGLNYNLPTYSRWVYKKGIPPFNLTDFDTAATPVISHHGFFDKMWKTNGAAFTDITSVGASATANDIALPGQSGDAIYVGKTEKFETVEWGLDPNTLGLGGTVTWEYWNGASWKALNDYVFGKNTSFSDSGIFTFVPDSDWQKTTVNGEGTSYYYLRARILSNYTVAPIGSQFTSIPIISYLSSTAYSTTANTLMEENCSSYNCLSLSRSAALLTTAVPTPTPTPTPSPSTPTPTPTVAPVVCAFTGPTTLTIGETGTFVSTSTGEIVSWVWSANGGSPTTGIASTFQWSSNTVGTYTISLMVTDTDAQEKACQIEIPVTNPPTPTPPVGSPPNPTVTPTPTVIIPIGPPKTGRNN